MKKQDAVKYFELVSALADGQLRGDEFADTVEWVGNSDDARLTWQTYHLLGDVMRSGESMVGRTDGDFMARLRDSLQREAPITLGLQGLESQAGDATLANASSIQAVNTDSANDARFRWKLLAGVASLATVLIVAWQAPGGWGNGQGALQLAQMNAQVAKPATMPDVALQQMFGEPQVMIRDPQLDALLAAHKQFGGTSALQMPAGFLRNATFEGVAR